MGEKRVKLRGIRKLVAANMKRSSDDIPMGYCTTRVDLTEMLKMQRELREQGIKVSDSVFFMRATVIAVKKYPNFNARSESVEEAIYYDEINPGIAVDSPRGLLSLTLRDVGGLSLLELAEKFRELMNKLKTGTLLPDDYTGSTFTISNLGKTTVHDIGPLVTNHECFIMGFGGIHKEASVMEDGSIAARDVCYMTLTNNHILVDGADCTRFLDEMKRVLEHPGEL